MATSTIRSSGGDYATITLWEAATDNDLVTATEGEIGELYDDWISGLDEAVIIAGATANATYHRKLTVASGHRHNGTPQSGFFMESAVNNSALISVDESYAEIEWLDVKNTKNLAYTRGIEFGANAQNCSVSFCIACAPSRTAFYTNPPAGTGDNKYISSLAYNSAAGFNMQGTTTAVSGHNCVSANNTTGFTNANLAYDKKLINCIAYGNSTSYVAAAFDHASSTNNAASDGSTTTPPGSNPITADIVSADFVDAAINNWHIASTARTNLYHAGSSTTTAEFDIDGDTFDLSTPSIGFDEIVSSGTNLVIQDGAHAHAADNLTLTQQNTLAIQEASHAHAADNLTLNAGANLIVQDGAHSHSADNLTLTQQNTLAIQEASHAHAADNLTLNAGANLIVQDGAHSHSADNLTLTQQNSLIIQAAAHAHIANNLTLTQQHILAIQDALHVHSADNVVLSLATLLAIQDGAHAHSANNLTLTQHNSLAIQDALHAHIADNLDLEQQNVLIISDALHATISDNVTLSIPSGSVTPRRRTYIIEHEGRTYIVIAENRTMIIH